MNINEAIFSAVSGDVGLLNEIRNAIAKDEAFCFGADDVRMVLRPRSKNGIPYVVIWLGASIGHNNMVKYLPEVQQLTRMIGGRWVEFYTVRKGFIRVAPRLGFERLPDEDGLMKFKIPV